MFILSRPLPLPMMAPFTAASASSNIFVLIYIFSCRFFKFRSHWVRQSHSRNSNIGRSSSRAYSKIILRDFPVPILQTSHVDCARRVSICLLFVFNHSSYATLGSTLRLYLVSAIEKPHDATVLNRELLRCFYLKRKTFCGGSERIRWNTLVNE